MRLINNVVVFITKSTTSHLSPRSVSQGPSLSHKVHKSQYHRTSLHRDHRYLSHNPNVPLHDKRDKIITITTPRPSDGDLS